MLAALLAPLLFAPGPADSVPARVVAVPRIAAAAVRVDGRLDEPVWDRAAVLRGFTQYLPLDGLPADDSTTVLVWYSPTAIYFGVRAWQDSAGVRASVADRDRIAGDDYVQILLDTFDDHRRAFVFGVNPLGVQADGTVQDTARSAIATLTAAARDGYAVDLSPDFAFESRGRRTAQGWEVEIRIPFGSLRYRAAATQDWGINVIRKVQATGHEHTWAPVRQSDASFLGASGVLAGLSGLEAGTVVELTPEATSTVSGGPDPAGRWDYRSGWPRLGGTVRWGLTSNLTVNGTVNPDFSQVEADLVQFRYDPRDALYYPESRAFFLDGAEYFRTPVQLMYTRRLAAPVAAFKLTGKAGPASVAVLGGVDDGTGSATGGADPLYTWLRLRWDVGGRGTLGVALADREERGRWNRVGALDGRVVFGGAWALVFQGGGSATRDSGATAWAPFGVATLSRAGRSFGLTATVRAFAPGFRAEGGYVSRVNTAFASLVPSYTHHGAPGAVLETWWVSVALNAQWYYDALFRGAGPDHPQGQLSAGLTLRGGWQVLAAAYVESYGRPVGVYADYAVLGCPSAGAPQPGDTVTPACARPFTPPASLRNVGGSLTLATPRFQHFSLDADVIAGRDDNFLEWAPATIVLATVEATWRPSERVRVSPRYDHQQYVRAGDGSTVQVRRVPRLKVEYQLARAVFLRVVGQYDAQRTAALRDDGRTDAPLLLCTARDPATGACARYRFATATASNALRMDWLFSYRPTPGTVLFLGYGCGLEEPDAFRFRALRRTADGFFAKLSYRLRV